jgi:hypothetical protein
MIEKLCFSIWALAQIMTIESAQSVLFIVFRVEIPVYLN